LQTPANGSRLHARWLAGISAMVLLAYCFTLGGCKAVFGVANTIVYIAESTREECDQFEPLQRPCTTGEKTECYCDVGEGFRVCLERGEAWSICNCLREQKWEVPVEGFVRSPPRAAAGGMVFVGSADGKLYAVDSDGYVTWKKSLGLTGDASPAIGKQGTVYVSAMSGEVGCLFALKPGGDVKWKVELASGPVSTPVIGPHEKLYVASGNELYAVDEDGGVVWRFVAPGKNIPGISSPSVGRGGAVFFVVTDPDSGAGILFARSLGGGHGWQFRLNSGFSTPAVPGEGGVVYIGSRKGYLHAIDAAGHTKWKVYLGSEVGRPAVGADGRVYAGAGNMLWNIGREGQKLWGVEPYKVPAAGCGFMSAPLVGNDGTIYATSTNGYLYALDKDGRQKWLFSSGERLVSAPVLGKDGTVYVCSEPGLLYALQPAEAEIDVASRGGE